MNENLIVSHATVADIFKNVLQTELNNLGQLVAVIG